ncbi:hypothetical protein [Amycolatopsis minnesotensis]|uniref:Uncharacterized protein n=1 Tax=Amycolatopsis minnesotensis TaxID=337894 RepID=A0ABP5E8T7_9PSEU
MAVSSAAVLDYLFPTVSGVQAIGEFLKLKAPFIGETDVIIGRMADNAGIQLLDVGLRMRAVASALETVCSRRGDES